MNKFTEATVRGNVDDIMKEKKPLKLSDLDQLDDGSKAKCVLVQGAPGVGKTTMAQELCRQWAEEKLFKHYSLLVLLKLRDESVQSATEEYQLFDHPSVSSAVATIIGNKNGEGTMFLLDGFDELPQEMQKNSIFVRLINKKFFPQACVIITSRPSASHILYSYCSCQNHQHVEVLGFTKEQINSFVGKWFEESSRENERHQFELYLRSYPHIHALMYIPLNCSIVIDVYQSSNDNSIPKTQTELYTRNTLIMLNRYINSHKIDGRMNWNLENLADISQAGDLKQKLLNLGKVAHNGELKQHLVFKKELIPQDLRHNEAMGFMNIQCDRLGSASYNFLHLTIQEFLAAYYITTRPSSEQEQMIRDSIGKRHLEIMLRFYAGLSSIQQGSVASRTLTNWLQTHYDSDPNRRLEYLRWMFEAQDKELLRHTLSNGTQDLDLSNQTLSPFDCYILGYCIANLNEGKFQQFSNNVMYHYLLREHFHAGDDHHNHITYKLLGRMYECVHVTTLSVVGTCPHCVR